MLLDECIDRRLVKDLVGHDTKTVPQAGWAGLRNGALLGRAEGQFDVFVTVDRRIPSQQNLSRFSIAVIVLRARSIRLADLRPLVPRLLAVARAKRGEVTWGGYGRERGG